MLTKKQNDLLNQTGASSPLGQLMRRYWIPALLSEEILQPDSPQVRVHILGEELVAFRDTNGRIGLLAEHCSHRGTSLFYARNELCGLRCGYHGWKMDVDGNVLDTPAEPPDSRFKSKVKHIAYPTHEAGGVIWAYMGPKAGEPAFPNYSWTQMPEGYTYVTKSFLDCSWLQGLEGECDSAHLNFLHRIFSDKGSEDLYTDNMPHYETEDTDFGVRLIATRRGDEDQSYIRVSSFVTPLSVWVPARNKEVHMYVPIEDGSSWRWDFGISPHKMEADEPIPRRDQIDERFMRFRNASNDYLIDREEQQTKTFLGLGFNFLPHDGMATESMGHIYDRRTEHLAVSDMGVIAVRRFLLKSIEKLQDGEPLPHTSKDPEDPQGHIDTFAEFMPPDKPWREHYPHLTLEGRDAVAQVHTEVAGRDTRPGE